MTFLTNEINAFEAAIVIGANEHITPEKLRVGVVNMVKPVQDIMQLGVISRVLSSPPASPLDGDKYLIPTGAAGAWSGRGKQISVRRNGQWIYYAPETGWRAWVADEGEPYWYTGAEWMTQTTVTLTIGQGSSD